MGEEKRFVVFLVATMLIVVLTPPLFNKIFGPPPRPRAAAKDAQKQAPDAEAKEEADKPLRQEPEQAKPEEPAAPREAVVKAPEAPMAEEKEADKETRILGSTDPASGFKLKVQLTNHGAAVEQIELADFQNENRSGPLQLLSTIDEEEGSFLLGVKGLSNQLEKWNWMILPVPADPNDADSASVRFQATLPHEKLVITKTYSLQKGSYNLGLEIEVANRGDVVRQVAYRLAGPRGSVLEGAWYATKKRDAAIAGGSGNDLKRQTVRVTDLVKGAKAIEDLKDATGAIRREKRTLNDDVFERFDWDQNGRLSGDEVQAAAYHLAGEKSRWAGQPVRFAGVDSQFFCTLLIVPTPKNDKERWDAVTTPILVSRNNRYPDRGDVSVEIESKSFDIEAGDAIKHPFTIYAGPRKKEILENSHDKAIADSIMNFQGALFIFPSWLTSLTASTMLFLLQTFHGWVGNWGVAIIMLTVMVRMLMFPLSRKQALSAVKMQTLKPELDALREKYKNDKEKIGRAQMELYRKHGVNPLGGCLPLLVQMPIFIGLWQGLQSSVDLRLSKFLWIDNLAAPDGPSIPFFHWGENVPLLSWLLGPYFNLLPCILIGLMLIQQKMFMPPKADPPDPQMEMQQKMMTYMMVMFACFFWRLPSGLCVYYICSTLWGICERKLLPRIQHAPAASSVQENKMPAADNGKPSRAGRDGRGSGRDGKERRAGARSEPSLMERINELLKKANKR